MLKLFSLTVLLAVSLGAAGAELSRVRTVKADSYLPLASEFDVDERLYIVQLEEPPALAYEGGEPGLPPTRPTRGERFDAADPRVRDYGRHLVNRHDKALRSVGAYQQKLYSYRYAFNGFAARMTPAQADKLRAQRGVTRVWQDRMRYLQTNDSARFLGILDGEDGLRVARGLKGEDVVIAVIDSGIAPEHPSFQDSKPAKRPAFCRGSFAENTLLGLWLCTKFRRKDDRLSYQPLEGWTGACEAGDEDQDKFTADDCNNKLIGARFYIDGFLERNALDANEFISPRDADGHGTHIASTAAGNDVRAKIAGQNVARIAGMAPRARIAVYKACWLEPGQTRGTCSTADLQRAIEDAVQDGVDIINYSVGSSDLSITDPDDLALLAASDAGVLSVVAAGNDGPAPGTILSPAAAPWVLSVGVSTRSGTKFERALKIDSPGNLAGNYVFREATFTPKLRETGSIEGELVLVDDNEVTISGAETGTTFDGCEEIDNDTELDGQIALLQRGVCTFEEKLINAENAGAAAAIVFNNEGGLIDMSGTRNAVDIPAVMISQSDGQRLLDELNDDQTIELTLSSRLIIDRDAAGDRLADQSARGPNLAAPDILKPDLTAPGVDILAGQTRDVANGIRGEDFQYLTGTSMSVPHVAGVAALLKEAHPDWSPAALRSALMTTARQDVVLDADGSPATPFDFGAGHVNANRSLDPGLVYEAGKDDYDAFNCGSDIPRISDAECTALEAGGASLDPSDLNLPSIAVAELPATESVSRRVTLVGDNPATFEATVTAPDGIDIQVSPSSLSLSPGQTATYTVDFTNLGAAVDEWAFGSLTWSDGLRQVRSPVAVQPVDFSAPIGVAGTGADGSVEFEVAFGYDGSYQALPTGLSLATRGECLEEAGGVEVVVDCVIGDDPGNAYVQRPIGGEQPASVERFFFDTFPPDSDPGARVVLLRVALFNEDTQGEDDLDFYVYERSENNTLTLIGQSTNPDSDEFFEVEFPRESRYVVDVHGFDTDPANGGSARFDLSIWRLLSDTPDQGSLSITAPTAAGSATTATITAEWSGLATPGRYLGGVEHRNPDDPDPLDPFTTIDVFVPEP